MAVSVQGNIPQSRKMGQAMRATQRRCRPTRMMPMPVPTMRTFPSESALQGPPVLHRAARQSSKLAKGVLKVGNGGEKVDL